MSETVQVMTTVDDRDTAQELAKSLVELRLAACAQVLGPIRSSYRWEGEVVEDEEWLLLLKSRRELYERLEEAIKARHPYSVPEILAVPVACGNRDYLEWLARETRRPGG